MYKLSEIAAAISANYQIVQDNTIEYLAIDSRKIANAAQTLFFALPGIGRSGSLFIPDLYNAGCMQFVVEEGFNTQSFPKANFITTPDVLKALQALAAYHRKKYNLPVIAITGSNGKTIVKEWLYQLLQHDYVVARSPKSYNSQIGVALSVWQIRAQHNLAIIEAGISQTGEMEKLEEMIQPSIGILTNIGEAHSEGFSSSIEKLSEKIKLFKNVQTVIYDFNNQALQHQLLQAGLSREQLVSYPYAKVSTIKKEPLGAFIHYQVLQSAEAVGAAACECYIPFADEAYINNALTCLQLMVRLGYQSEAINSLMQNLQPVNMRLEIKKGINQCTIINDSYSADLSSIHIALLFSKQQSAGRPFSIILSDILESGLPQHQLYEALARELSNYKIDKLIGIGDNISYYLPSALQSHAAGLQQLYYNSTDGFIKNYRSSNFRDEYVLIKGARVFQFERIVNWLEHTTHQTVLEINLTALANNVKAFKKNIRTGTRILAMVKALAYGSGAIEIAGVLQHQKIDYLGVAYPDEAVALRKAGITLPIMVLNTQPQAFDQIVEYSLEPVIYSFNMLQAFLQFLGHRALQHHPVHIEIETGMNRLGFSIAHVPQLIQVLLGNTSIKIQSVFSHLASSDYAPDDAFTQKQFEVYSAAAAMFEQHFGATFLKHICNSVGAIRFPQMHLDMVRIGIGLYGAVPSPQMGLQQVATLRSGIAQLKTVGRGETVSYNRRGLMEQDSIIAIVRIGYADGYFRSLGNGQGHVMVRGQRAPVVGAVCMDMLMANVTHIPGVEEGDEVIIFGGELPIAELAALAGTIPYEIMTNISQRVKRVYYEE